jgi:hypothetical protein
VQFFQKRVGEACADVADCFVVLGVGIVRCQKEGSIDRRPFATAKVSAENGEIE